MAILHKSVFNKIA